ncbi:hypothetical protein CF319_g8467 [Tilletia indica]|nr:hypothetical protein CF319_g8467 [Tilletia indica]
MADAYATHILSRLQADIAFLESTGHLRTADALIIRQTLASSPVGTAAASSAPASAQSAAINAISARAGAMTSRFAQMAASKRSAPTPPGASTPAVPVMAAPKPATPPPQQDLARATWSYTAAASATDELNFAEGDTIVIVERTSPDWWKGYVSTRPGAALLFPANYVEPIAAPAARALPPAYGYSASSPSSEKQEAAYTASGRLIPQARFSSGGPPPPPVDAQGQQAQAGPSTANGVDGLTPAMTEEQKAKKNAGMKRLGGTMAHGAAGGVGFGVGVGLINAIF